MKEADRRDDQKRTPPATGMPPTPISLLVVATAITLTLSTSFSPNLRANFVDPFVLPPALQEKNKYDAHQVRLESLGYFFKTYTARADQALDHARETVRRVLGDDVVQQKVFAGRASLFEEAGSLHKYVPLVYELAGIKGEHKKEKHKRLPMNHTIAMIEERMELGLIEFTTYHHYERSILSRRLHLHPHDPALDAVLMETHEQRNRRGTRSTTRRSAQSPPFQVTPRLDPVKEDSGNDGEDNEDADGLPDYVKQVQAMMDRTKAAREAAKAKGKAVENMRKASQKEEEIKQKKEKIATQKKKKGPSHAPPPLTKAATKEQVKDEKEGEETMKKVEKAKEEKIKTAEESNEAAKKLLVIEKKAEENAAGASMKSCEQEMKRLGLEKTGDGMNEGQDEGEDPCVGAEEEHQDEESDLSKKPMPATNTNNHNNAGENHHPNNQNKEDSDIPNPDHVVMDFVVDAFNGDACTNDKQGTVINDGLVCRIDTSTFVDDGNIHMENTNKLIEIYTLAPDYKNKPPQQQQDSNTMWNTDTGEYLKHFHDKKVLEINIRKPNTLATGTHPDYDPEFHWLFPSGKTIEIALMFELTANDQTRCPAATIGHTYSAPIESFHQPTLYQQNINPFFQGDIVKQGSSNNLNEGHEMSTNMTQLIVRIDNYTIEQIPSTIKSSFRTISLRIPYDNAQICEGYSFPSSTALLQQYPTLRITMYPYDDGQPASITSDTKGEEKEQEKAPKKKEKKSCAQVKMEKATKCAKQLAEVQLSNEGGGDGKMSEKICTLLRSMKSKSLAAKIPSLCPALDPEKEKKKTDAMNDCISQGSSSPKCNKLFENAPVSLHDVLAIEKAKQKVKEAAAKAAAAPKVSIADAIAAEAWGAMDSALKNKEKNDKNTDTDTKKDDEEEEEEEEEEEKEEEKEEKEEKEEESSASDFAKHAAAMAAKAKGKTSACDPSTGKSTGGANSLSDGGESGWPNGVEPPEAAGYDAKIEAAHKKRVVGIKMAQAFATLLEGAGGMALGAAVGESLATTSSKMGRLATAMATAMVTTMWMGTMSAPWILDGRMEELCKISIVEKRDYCNKENDKALTDCPVAAPAVSSICVKQIAEVTDPGTMTTLMNPPPVGTGPAPPFANAPCVTKQGPCQKDVADQFMMGIITEFQEAIKTLGKDSAAVGKAMGEGGAAMGKGGGQMGAAAAFLEMPERSTILLDIGSELQLKMMGDPGAALEQFAKADVDARHAQMEWGNALVDKADFQVATAEQSTDKCAQAAALINRGKAKEAQFQAEQDMGRAKNNMASAAAAAAAFAKGVPLEGDRQFKLDVPLGSNEEKFTCIKFDLFGCGCKSLPSYETLSGGDCADMKNIILENKANDFKKGSAANFQGQGKGSAEKYGNFAKAAGQEDAGRL